MKHNKGSEKLKMSKSSSRRFFGLHFDFHANDDCIEIGKNVTVKLIEKIIVAAKPDYIQCDSKGHRGFSSYPTRCGNPAPGFVKDPLAIWRKVTAAHNIPLYVHHSGVFDTEAIRLHPTWARIDEKGKCDSNNTSVFGKYADKLLIPQIKELIDKYQIDGVWFDGECWATMQDYSKNVIEAFRKKTGIKTVPRTTSAPFYFEFLEFCREGFRNYLRHYTDCLHAYDPNLKIASNWAFTTYMPEPVSAEIDFISGDLTMLDSVNAARLEARCIQYQKKPWDIMSWAFCARPGENTFSVKSAAQLQQEAAIVLSLGGGFQAYFNQKRDASISVWQLKLMSEIAKFCRLREKCCFNATPIPEIAVLYSSYAYYHGIDKPFSPWDGTVEPYPIQYPVKGVLRMLLESQRVVDVVFEHQLAERLHEYKAIVLPECKHLDEEFKKALIDYVAKGGNLIVVGAACTKLFADQLGVEFLGDPVSGARWLACDGVLGGMNSVYQKIKTQKGVRVFEKMYGTNDFDAESIPAVTIRKLGKGKIAGVYVDIGERYCKSATTTCRKFLDKLVGELVKNPLIEVTGSQYVDVMLTRCGSKLNINLVNTSGPHSDNNVYVFDEILPVGPLNITLHTTKKPRSIMLEPGNKPVPFSFNGTSIEMKVSQLDLHSIIVVDGIL